MPNLEEVCSNYRQAQLEVSHVQLQEQLEAGAYFEQLTDSSMITNLGAVWF